MRPTVKELRACMVQKVVKLLTFTKYVTLKKESRRTTKSTGKENNLKSSTIYSISQNNKWVLSLAFLVDPNTKNN